MAEGPSPTADQPGAAQPGATEAADATAAPEFSPEERRRNIIGFFFMAAGMFMSVLDVQIVASSLAQIQAGLSAAPDEISWVQSAYLIAEVIVMPLTGFLSRALSTRYLFCIATAGFTAASILCAFAWSIDALIVMRAVQGLFGGIMIPTMFATSYVVFGGTRSARASSFTGLIITLAPTMGPTLGGWITDVWSWKWLFLINALPGITITIAVFTLLRIDKPAPALLKKFDWVGLATIAPFLGALQYVLEEGSKKDWFQDDGILALSVLSLAAGIIFIRNELRVPNPIVNLRVFRHKDFAKGTIVAFVIGVGLYGSTFLLPLFLARVLRWSSFDIGTIMAVTGACQMISAPLASYSVRIFDVRKVVMTGLALFGVGVFLNIYLTSQSGFNDLLLPQMLRGLAFMMCAMPATVLAIGSLPMTELKDGSGLFTVARNLGGAIGIAVISTLLTSRQAVHELRLRENFDWGRTAAANMVEGMANHLSTLEGSALKAGDAALRIADMLIRREAMAMTFADLQWLMALTFFLLVLAFPLMRFEKRTMSE